jgi:hypothetical protein
LFGVVVGLRKSQEEGKKRTKEGEKKERRKKKHDR